MRARSLDDDTVAMSESIGVAVLVGMTILVTAVVGLSVLVVDSDAGGGPQANFTYDYVESNELLIVTHSRGDALEAGRIEFEGPEATTTWAAVANRNETAMVEPGDLAQLSSGNAYGRRVSGRDTVTIYYNQSGNRTRLDRWNGG
ncbi:type IV pilin N-terminal domain-containing protein [Haloarcula limicola]|nr:type IV pilin N-terminal domain-containing protein [Halomicroarcula limicola]